MLAVSRKHAGIVLVSAFSELIKGPFVADPNAKARRTISGNTLASQVLEKQPRLQDVLTIGSATRFIDQFMPIPMARDLMAFVRDAANEIRMSRRDPPQDEKRRLLLCLREGRQNPISIPIYSAFEVAPT